MLLSPPLDIGIILRDLLASIPYVLIILAIVILVEAFFLSDYLEIRFMNALWYSYVINIASTVVGIPVVSVFYGGAAALLSVYELPIQGPLASLLIVGLWILFPFLLTLLVEHFTLAAILRPSLARTRVLKAVFKINVISYILLPVGLLLFAAFSLR